MVKKVFVDTDVVIDFLTDRKPFACHASILFELHEQGKIQIHLSALSISNIYYVSRRFIGEKATLALIEKLIDNIEIVGTTKTEIQAALQTGFKVFEDAIQYTTALTVKKIDAIITRNVRDFRKAKVATFTPEIYLKSNFTTD